MFPLHPSTPHEGLSLAALFGSNVNLATMRQRMEGLMATEGLPYGHRTHTYNTRRAQELAKWAEKQQGGKAIHAALYRAYFVDGVNLADLNQLLLIAASIGIATVDARAVLEEHTEASSVEADWARARAFDVTAVPTFMANSVVVVGAQPYANLEQLVVQAGAQRR